MNPLKLKDMKNVKKTILLTVVLFAPLFFTGCEEETIKEPPVFDNVYSDEEKDVENDLD